jgi:hypothetical protein
MLVLMMGGINELGHWNWVRWHDMHTKFHEDWFKNSNIKVITSTIWEASVLVLMIGVLMKHAFQMIWSCLY